MRFSLSRTLGLRVLALTGAAACLAFASGAAAQEAEPVLSAADVSQPEGWDSDLRMAEAEDVNPDPGIVEIHLEARITEMEILPGTTTPVWAYNGTLPGPLIRARTGTRLIVHFTNALPEPTTIHWHGIRLPNAMDGAPGLTQDPIEPGETFVYDFVLDDPGLYWYHPHFNSPAQVSAGLYGAIVVEDPDDPEAFGDELILVLSDIALDPDGSIRPADRGGAFGDLFGREGNILLVNGKMEPTLKARAGKQQRWRIVNSAIARYFPIALRFHTWTRVGGDSGLIARAEELPRMVIAPGERADLIFTPQTEPGSESVMYWLPPNRGLGTATGRGRESLLHIETVADAPVRPLDIPQTLRDIPPIDLDGAIKKTVELTIHENTPRADMMGINGEAHRHTLHARIGETHVWTLLNSSDFDHPFHLHGYFFQVLDESRVPEWKDTVNVPAHSSLRIAVEFDDRPGLWMFHCHILDHAEVGMMGNLVVSEADGTPPPRAASGHAHHH